ncbi:MAG: hypothetical protein GC201_10095 [Alphaproteobacteria bacterium]|nr:hypothetical protein [Alphaproteobacteria bacterium]
MPSPFVPSHTAIAVLGAILTCANAAQAADCTEKSNTRQVPSNGEFPFAVINVKRANANDIWYVTSRKFNDDGKVTDTNDQKLAVSEKLEKIYRQRIRAGEGTLPDGVLKSMVVKFAYSPGFTEKLAVTCRFDFHAGQSSTGNTRKTWAKSVACAGESFITCSRQYKAGTTPNWEYDIILGKPPAGDSSGN